MSAPVLVVFCMDTEGPCADPTNPDLLASWDAVDAAMEKLFDPDLRSRHRDSEGGSLRIFQACQTNFIEGNAGAFDVLFHVATWRAAIGKVPPEGEVSFAETFVHSAYRHQMNFSVFPRFRFVTSRRVGLVARPNHPRPPGAGRQSSGRVR